MLSKISAVRVLQVDPRRLVLLLLILLMLLMQLSLTMLMRGYALCASRSCPIRLIGRNFLARTSFTAPALTHGASLV
jgi:hypothetical protein